MAERRPYQIVESERFTLQTLAILGDFWVWEDIKSRLDLAIAQDPHSFRRVADTPFNTAPLNTNPPHALYFSIDDEHEVVVFEAVF